MRYGRLVLLAATAFGLLTCVASAETIATMDGHYYKLVPLRGPLPRYSSEVVTVIPQEATANVAQAGLGSSSCRLTNFQNGEYEPEYTTVCGPP